MVTLKDIAEKANVSIGTVSRYLNNNIKVKKETEERLLRAIDELGYVPNRIARALRDNVTNNIAVVFPRINNLYYSEITAGISEILSKNSYNLSIYETDNMKLDEDGIIDLLRENVFAGVIFIGMSYDMSFRQSINRLVDLKVPVVYMNRSIPYEGFPLVYPDYKMAAQLAADHFVGLGRKKIALVHKHLSTYSLDKYIKVFSEKYSPENQALILEIKDDNSLDGEIIPELIKENIDGVFVLNELNSVYLTLALTKKGIRVPEDISVISLGNSLISEISMPKMTSIDFCNHELGEVSARCILDQINKKEIKNIQIIEPKLIKRESA